MRWSVALRGLALACLCVSSHGLAGNTRYRNPTVRPGWYRARQRSMTPAQKRAERALWPHFGLTFEHGRPIDLDAAFGSSARPRLLEIGCGEGEALASLAASRPGTDLVGVDWFRRGLATCLQRLEDDGAANARLVRADAYTLLASGLPAQPLFDEAWVLFPDPWYASPERRVLRPDVVEALTRRMRPSGSLFVATDVEGYADHVVQTMAAAGWEQAEAEWPGHRRPDTRYAREAAAAGRAIDELRFELPRGGGAAG